MTYPMTIDALRFERIHREYRFELALEVEPCDGEHCTQPAACELARMIIEDTLIASESPEVAEGGPYCSFCGKGPYSTATIIAGIGVFICAECVRTCAEQVDEAEQARL